MFVLRDDLETKKRGKLVYFEAMTCIGPMYTEKLDKAEKFDTEQDAMNCPAFINPLCFFEPYEINNP